MQPQALFSLGGAVGVAALGSVMASRVALYADHTMGSLSRQEQVTAAKATATGGLPHMDLLPTPIRRWLESAYGHGIADIFLYTAPFAFLTFLLTLFIKEVPLRRSGGR